MSQGHQGHEGNQARPERGGATDVGRVRVLVVDDEALNLDLLERSLRRRFEVIKAESPERALEILREASAEKAENSPTDPARTSDDEIAMILSDFRMPGMTGAELLAESVRTHPYARRVIITGYADSDSLINSINSGRIHYVVTKPWKHKELHQILDQLMHGFQLERENRRLLGNLRGINEELRTREERLSETNNASTRELVSANRELDRVGRELEILSFKDALTGLYNHRAFQERLTEELARARRHDQPVSLICADVDNFAALNRDLGYQLGDEVLRRVADLVCATDSSARVRASDIVARYGGEEFAILMPETPKAGAVIKADRLRAAIGSASFPGGKAVTVSFGLASFPEDASSPAALLRCAEDALRTAKQGGKDAVQLYSASSALQATVQSTQPAPEGQGPKQDSNAPVVGVPTFSDIERFPTYYSQIDNIVRMLRRERAASCLYIDLGRLRRIELEFGVAKHGEVFGNAGVIIDSMRGECLRGSDIICRTQDDDGYLCILSPARTRGRADTQLEQIAARVCERLNQILGPEVDGLLREHPRVSVGYSRVLNNSMTRPERLVSKLVAECRESAALEQTRAGQQNKTLLQEVILGEELTPVYQPIVHLRSGEIFGFEALTRGPRNTALESPVTLFSVADEVDLTFELDRACFRSCLRGAIGLEPVHRLFVNLLPLSFYDAAFIESEVNHLLEAAALTPANIVFEITEQLAIENFNSFRRALARYTSMGFGVAIDDVGTRHSNLETVMALRPNLIKVSDVLTRGIARSTVKREMLHSLGRIAEAVDAVVVAEGIETPDDLVVLYDMGITYGQGYFLARPGPPFPRLRASVRRAVSTLARSNRAPIPAPPADSPSPKRFDDHGERQEDTSPGAAVQERVRLMADGSDRFSVGSSPAIDALPIPPGIPPLPAMPSRAMHPREPRLDDFEQGADDETRPIIHDSGAWSPLRVQNVVPGGPNDSEGSTQPSPIPSPDNQAKAVKAADDTPLMESLRLARKAERLGVEEASVAGDSEESNEVRHPPSTEPTI